MIYLSERNKKKLFMNDVMVEIESKDRAKWNELVKSFSDYDVFYLNEYVHAFAQESIQNGLPVLLYYSDGSDTAINVVFKRDISHDKKLRHKIEEGRFFDLITPYGYGGFRGNISDWDKLNRIYKAYCMENHFICEFVRFELFGDYYEHYEGEVETKTRNVVRSLELPLDEIWMDFKHKVRKNVKKANTFNLSCIVENSGTYLDDFLLIYNNTIERNDADSEYYFSREFFERLNEMPDNIMYFHVVYEGKIISTELVIYGAKNCYSYLGGTDREYFYMRPNDYLKYEIIKWAKKKGFKNYVLGGGYGADDGIFNYKLCLAPHGLYDFYIGRRVFDDDTYLRLVDIRAIENPECRESEYFPKYRA